MTDELDLLRAHRIEPPGPSDETRAAALPRARRGDRIGGRRPVHPDGACAPTGRDRAQAAGGDVSGGSGSH